MENKHKVTLRESELRYVVMEAVRRTLNERINRMLCEEGGPGDFMPYELRERFVNIIRNASHFSQNDVKREVMKFYKQYFAKVNKQSFILDKLMDFADRIEAAEIQSSHIIPCAGRCGNGFKSPDYDADRRAYDIGEANIGRGTDTSHYSSFSGDDFGGSTFHGFQTSENPYMNDSVLMLANRFEKRLGGSYKVTAHNNTLSSEDDNEYGETVKSIDSSMVDFVVGLPGNGYGNIDDVIHIATVAKKMFGAMSYDISVSGVEFDPESEMASSITIRVNLRNVNEPRKDMIPKRGTYMQNDNGHREKDFADTNFSKPQYWSYTDN